MPRLEYAFICDHVRIEGGLAHVIAAGIDTIQAPEVPTGANVGLVARFTFTRNECGRPHRIEAIFQDADGEPLFQLQAVITPEWTAGLPAGWRQGATMGLNFGLPLPKFGEYSLEILLNDNEVASIPMRVIRAPTSPDATTEG